MANETVSTSYSFNLPVDEIIDMALEGLGGEHITGKEAKLARRALNLLLIDIQNYGIAPLAALEQVEIDLVSGSNENYLLPSQYFNVLEGVVEVCVSTSGAPDVQITDYALGQISYEEWLRIPTKEKTTGRPTQFLVDKDRDNIKLSFWPNPDRNRYTFKAWATRQIADVDASYQLLDIPRKYLSAIVSGLRYKMADLRGVDLNLRAYYKREYLDTLELALSEDRERVDLDFYPTNKIQLGA